MKKNISTIGLLLSGVLLTISGCGNKSNSEQTATPDNTKQEVTDIIPKDNPDWKTYTVGMDTEYPPYVMKNENGSGIGFDIDILQAIATDQQFNILPIPTRWDKYLAGVEVGKYDMAVGGWSAAEINDKTKEHYDLSNPHIYAVDVIGVINQEITINKFNDLKDYNVSTLTDTNWIENLEELDGTGSVVEDDSSFQAVQSLLQKKADVTLNDKGVLLYYSKTLPEHNIQVSEVKGYAKPYDLIMLSNKKQEGLLDKVNTGLANIIENGSYTKIYTKWFGIAPDKLPNPFPTPVPTTK